MMRVLQIPPAILNQNIIKFPEKREDNQERKKMIRRVSGRFRKTRAIIVIIFARPSFIPGMKKLIGIKASIMVKTRACETIMAIKTFRRTRFKIHPPSFNKKQNQ